MADGDGTRLIPWPRARPDVNDNEGQVTLPLPSAPAFRAHRSAARAGAAALSENPLFFSFFFPPGFERRRLGKARRIRYFFPTFDCLPDERYFRRYLTDFEGPSDISAIFCRYYTFFGVA